MSKFCFTCGGVYNLDFVNKPCPECGKQYKKGASLCKEIKPEIITAAKDIKIPQQYIGNFWDVDTLIKDNSDQVTNNNFKRYYTQLDRIHDKFFRGVLPSQSGIIISAPGMSKMTWAYSCMQEALKHGFTVNWLLDTIELKRLINLAGDNPRYKLYDQISYDDYMMADVCFITVAKTEAKFDAINVIMEVMETRARKGLATFVISRFAMNVLLKRDYDDHFKRLMDYNGRNNELKYPVIVHYENYNNGGSYDKEENNINRES